MCFLKDNFEAYPQSPNLPLPLFIDVTVYKDDGFHGTSQTFTLKPLKCFNLPSNWTDVISSAETKNDDCVVFFTLPLCTGPFKCACGKIDFFKEGPIFNDKTKSILPGNVKSLIKTCKDLIPL